jgi:hypothetical protein
MAAATSATEGKAWLGLRVLFNLSNMAPSISSESFPNSFT